MRKEEQGVVEAEMRKTDERDMEKIGVLDIIEKTIAIPGGRR